MEYESNFGADSVFGPECEITTDDCVGDTDL